MAIESTHSQSQPTDPFTYLYPYEFMLLTTFRKDGEARPTTVWFANDNGKLYVTTSHTTGKIKRIRNNGRVLLAPCDRTGQSVLGPQVEAYARELSPNEHEQARAALSKKYGAQFDALTSRMSTTMQRTYIVIEPRQRQE